MKSASCSKFDEPQPRHQQRLVKPGVLTPDFKTQESPSASDVLKSALQNPAIKTNRQ
jgi:hypothetical protein